MGKGFIKGLAAGAVLGAAASLAMSMQKSDRTEKARALKKAANEVKNRVVGHAKKLGKLTKASYDKIVDTTVAEYRGTKALTEAELDELKKELKKSWASVQKLVKK